MSTILDPSDSVVFDAVMVLSYPNASGDSCTTRTFIIYVQRVDAPVWQLLLCEDLGDRLGPPLGLFPGPKEGSATLVPGIGYIDVYYSGHLPGAVSGNPFPLQKERVTIANIWPLDLVACLRGRNEMQILVGHLPDLAEDLAPYVV